MKFALFILNVICVIGIARYTMNLKPEYEQKIYAFDVRFSTILKSIMSKSYIDGLDYISSLFGVVAAISVIIFCFAIFLLKIAPQDMLILNETAIFSLVIFFGIKWFTKPHKYSLKMLKDFSYGSLLIFIPLIFDIIGSNNLTSLFYKQLDKILFFVDLPVINNIWVMSIIMFLVILFILFSFWLMITTIFSFVAFFSLCSSFILINIYKLADRLCGEKILSPLCLLGIILSIAYEQFI